MSSPSPQEWLARYASHGDEAAFSALVRTQSPLVWRTAMRRLGDAQLAEEAVQNVFLALARKSASLASRPGLSLSAWLHRAAVLEASVLARSRSRRERRHRLWSLPFGNSVISAGAGFSPSPSSSSSSSSTTFFSSPLSGSGLTPFSASSAVPSALGDSALGPLLDEALSRLPELDRTVLLGRYFEERSYEELGGALGKTGAAVKKRAQRALGKIAAHLRRRGVVLPAGAVASLAAADFSPAALTGASASLGAGLGGGGCGASASASVSASAGSVTGPGAGAYAGAFTAPSALSWPQRLIFLMSTSKALLITAGLLLLLLGLSGWQSAANASLRQEILARRAALENQAGVTARDRADASTARSAAVRPASAPAQPLPDPIDGMTLVRLYAHQRGQGSDALLFEPVPPNWPEDMRRHYQQAGADEILRLIGEVSKAPVAGSLRGKIIQELILLQLPDHDPALALRLAVEHQVDSGELTGLMRRLASKDPDSAEKLLTEFPASGEPGSSSRSSSGSDGNRRADELMAGFGEFFAEKADRDSWRELSPELLAFVDRHTGSGLISSLFFGAGSGNDSQGPFFYKPMVISGQLLDLAGRVTDTADRDRMFSTIGQAFMVMQPDRVFPQENGTFIENGVLRLPVNPDPAHPETTSIVLPNVLDDPRFPAGLRDTAIRQGARYTAALRGGRSALTAVGEISAPESRDENLARVAEQLFSNPGARQQFDHPPGPLSPEAHRLLDQTLADTALALAVRENPELARTLAEKISDPQLRGQTLRAATAP